MRLILMCILLTGCASMPGYVSTYESKTDGTKHIDVAPGFIKMGFTSDIKLGLSWSSEMKPGDIFLVTATTSPVDPRNGLTINIDGVKATYSAIDTFSDLEQGFFRKRFPLKLELIRAMVAGKTVYIKVSYIGQTYGEGEFSFEQISYAKNAFKDFLTEYDKTVKFQH
jgi:hypothetical protein